MVHILNGEVSSAAAVLPHQCRHSEFKNNEITSWSYIHIYKQSCGSIVRPHSLLVNCHEIHECRNVHRYPLRFCLFHTLGSTYFTSTQGCICSTRHLSKQQDRLDCWSTSQRYMVWPIHLTELNNPEGRRLIGIHRMLQSTLPTRSA